MRWLPIVLFILPQLIFGQDIFVDKDAPVLTQEEKYAQNIKLEYINDVYIPKDVADAMSEIDRLSDETGRSRLLETDEQTAADVLVMGLGKWLIVNWNFYDGSRLSHKLKDYGVSHPDDMAKFLIVSYHRHLRQVPQELEERGKVFYDQRKKEQELRAAQRTIVKKS